MASEQDKYEAFEWLRRLSLGELVMLTPDNAAVLMYEIGRLKTLEAAGPWPRTHTKFQMGDAVEKTKGSCWHGHVVGWYSTDLTPEGYAVESDFEPGSVQIYPAAALKRWDVMNPFECAEAL
jgi:dihydrofolate reductase (trimethoprim resistance protein)